MIFIVDPLCEVLVLSLFTVFFGILLDITVGLNTLLEIIKKDPKLYFKGIMANYINLLFLAPIYYVFSYNLLLNYNSNIFNLYTYLGLLLIQSIGYYYVHKLMHVNSYFKWMHTFHHEFVITVPSSGNAVSIYEFQIAYVLPFLVGAILFKPSPLDFKYSIFTISCFNLFIHTKELEDLTYPFYLVSPNDHITHHKTRSDTYAAPIINIDNILKKSY
tara:strand:- start:324 stop:974 length:651 start_codon:yes stop_codon:yes gene_type:complete